MIYFELFKSFFIVSILTLGGGYSSLPFIESIIVKSNGWIDMQEYLDVISISQMTPGPFAINCATFVGMKVASIFGAVISTLGFVAPSFIIALLLAFLYKKYKNLKYVDGALESLKAGIIAIIAGAGLSLLSISFFNDSDFIGNIFENSIVNINIEALIIFSVSLFIILKFKPKLIPLILISGIIGGILEVFI